MISVHLSTYNCRKHLQALWDANELNELKFKRQLSVKQQESQYCVPSKESEHKLSLKITC